MRANTERDDIGIHMSSTKMAMSLGARSDEERDTDLQFPLCSPTERLVALSWCIIVVEQNNHQLVVAQKRHKSLHTNLRSKTAAKPSLQKKQ